MCAWRRRAKPFSLVVDRREGDKILFLLPRAVVVMETKGTNGSLSVGQVVAFGGIS